MFSAVFSFYIVYVYVLSSSTHLVPPTDSTHNSSYCYTSCTVQTVHNCTLLITDLPHMCFWDLHGGRNLSNYVHQAFSKRLVVTKWLRYYSKLT